MAVWSSWLPLELRSRLLAGRRALHRNILILGSLA